MKAFLKQLRDTLHSYLSLNSPNSQYKQVYIDFDRLGPGCYYNEELSYAICQSVCMIVVYTPSYKHEDHSYCRREYRAMEYIEKERIKKLGGRVNNKGMIIPIIFRGEINEIPLDITNSLHYSDFRNLANATPHIKSIKKYAVEIEKIAITILEYEKAFNDKKIDPCCGCDTFLLPSEEDSKPWDVKHNTLTFPFLGSGV